MSSIVQQVCDSNVLSFFFFILEISHRDHGLKEFGRAENFRVGIILQERDDFIVQNPP